MRNFPIVALVIAFSLVACQKKEREIAPENTSLATGSNTGKHSLTSMARFSPGGGIDYSQPISKDSANRMIQSYLTSINYPANDTTLTSLSFDADTLRSYLNDPGHAKIVTLKFMLAHKQSYMNSGKYGQFAGTKSNALTLVIVGLDDDDKYVYSRANNVYDHLGNCPDKCTGSTVTLQ
jgi:hypothetical protein